MKTFRHHARTPFVLPLIGSCRSCTRRRLKTLGFWPLAALIIGALVYTGCATTPVPSAPGVLCSVSTTEFNTWFESGAVSLNGVAKPANSLVAPSPTSPNCDFYKWSEQMFVWVNSPAPSTYGGGAHIFESPAFYDVSPPDSMGQRTLIPHSAGLIRTMGLRAAQAGAHDLPVIFDKAGRMFEIENPKLGPNNRPLILNEKNEQVEIGRIALRENKQPMFFDKSGNVIQRAKPLIRAELTQSRIVSEFTVGSISIFLDSLGNVIEMDQGQAGDSGVLEAVNGSLVYYATMVNDVWAYFVTGAKKGVIMPGTQFPTSNAELTQIKNFAIANGKPAPNPFPDPEALAIELKTSWVEAAGVPNLNTYITMTASIPTYNKTNPDHWTPNGQKTVQLALVGMHVVGSTAGNPEMVWATFEHKNNTPNDTYEYVPTSGMIETVNPIFSQAYLFCAASPDPLHLNELHMRFNSPNIDSKPGFHITPSNTIRRKAWGGAFDVSPNLQDSTTAESNSEIISINNNVRGFLDSADVRNNYIFIGATWTIAGAGPTGEWPRGNEVGTSQLENSTMETYQQGASNMLSAGSNCFSCHVTNTVHVSHMFTPVKSLF